jgi:hypothetical protein
MPEMRINYHKGELIPIKMEDEECAPFVEIFQCALGAFPIKYLGVPLHHDKLRRDDLYHLVDCLHSKMTVWGGKLLSSTATRELGKSMLVSIIHIYMILF